MGGLSVGTPAAQDPSALGTDVIDRFRQGRFRSRGRGLFAARMVLVGAGTLALSVPRLSGSGPTIVSLGAAVSPSPQGLNPGGGWSLLVGFLLSACAARLLLSHPRFGRQVTWISLVFDTAMLGAILLSSGGLFSPLIGTQPLLVAAFCLLYPPLGTGQARSALAPFPALLLLPLCLDTSGAAGWADALLLLWYGSLDLAVWFGLGWLQANEERSHVEVVRLQAQLRRHAVTEERTRLSREIHDGVGAALTSLVLQAELGLGGFPDTALPSPAQEPSSQPPPTVTALRSVKQTAEEAVEDLRRSLRHLRHDFDPVESAMDQCAAFERRHGLQVVFHTEGAPGVLGPRVELALYRILQESLTNILRHAEARQAWVALRFTNEGCRLSVVDDGKGFDAANVGAGSYGLRGMRERAASLGGSIDFQPADPGPGTAVQLFLPRQKERR